MLLALAPLSACGRPPPTSSPTETAEAAAAPRFVDAATGAPLAFDAVIDRLAEARVIYVGERHDHSVDHDVQRRIAEALHRRDGSIAFGFEMFQHPRQAALDAYVAREVDEAQMLDETEWETRWGWDFAMYRPIVSLGPRHRIPLVALNAPQELTRSVARQGIDALDDETRAALPELDLTVEAHREAVMEALAHHPGMSDEVRERFYAAQVVWDETMADRAAAFLARPDAPRRLVVLAGTMHVLRPAVPERAARRGATPYAIALPVDEGELEETVGSGVADVLWVTPPRE